jgi:5-methylcytosine-specific restriction protein A
MGMEHGEVAMPWKPASRTKPRSREPHTKPEHKKLYDLRIWRDQIQKQHLEANPLCVECQKEGLVVPATIVDHITPHKGDMQLFLDPENHQSLCKPHHDRKSGMERWA